MLVTIARRGRPVNGRAERRERERRLVPGGPADADLADFEARLRAGNADRERRLGRWMVGTGLAAEALVIAALRPLG